MKRVGVPFEKGSVRTVEAARKGGRHTAASRRKVRGPFRGTILDAMNAAGLTGSSWTPWRTFWRSVFGLGLTGQHVARYRTHTHRMAPPASQVSEAWGLCGRGAGKSRNAGLAGFYMAIRFNVTRLAPGEPVVVPILAANTRQAGIVFKYVRALTHLPAFAPFVHRVLKNSVELHSGVVIEVMAAKYQTLRGFTLPCVVCDEIAFWQFDNDAANPDSEVLDALRPGLDRVDDALLIGISSPYGRKGELFRVYDKHFGEDDPHTLIWNSDTSSMNPTFKPWRIERRFAEDASKAASEYGRDGKVQFRRDVEAFFVPDAVAAVTVPDRRELPPIPGTRYVAFADPSGGSQDSFTLAIGHAERNGQDTLGVLDCVRERRPPFNPDATVAEFADVLRSYGCVEVEGDRYGAEWVVERFARHGVTYKRTERTKSQIYRELIAPINAGRVSLLDVRTLRAQLIGLERRVARGGKDSIDHAPGGRDDVANAVAGVLVSTLPRVTSKKFARFR